MTRFVPFLLIAVLLCACSGGEPVRTPEAVAAEGVLRVAALNENRYPYIYWEDGRARGIEPDAARAVAASMQAEAEFIPFERGAIENAVESGRADVGIGCIAKGSMRKLAETAGYISERIFILTRRGEVYPSEAAMNGANVLRGYPPGTDGYADMEMGVAALLEGIADAYICGEYDALSAVDASGERLQAELYEAGAETVYAAVAAKQNERLYARVDEVILNLLESGEIWDIISGY